MKEKHFYAYVGCQQLKGGKLGHAYIRLAEDWNQHPAPPAAQADTFFAKRLGHTRPGQVIAVEAKDEKSVLPHTVEVVGSFPTDVCLEWTALSRTQETVYELERRAKNEGKRDLLEETLQPFAEQYAKLHTRAQRAAFLTRVILAVTRDD